LADVKLKTHARSKIYIFHLSMLSLSLISLCIFHFLLTIFFALGTFYYRINQPPFNFLYIYAADKIETIIHREGYIEDRDYKCLIDKRCFFHDTSGREMPKSLIWRDAFYNFYLNYDKGTYDFPADKKQAIANELEEINKNNSYLNVVSLAIIYTIIFLLFRNKILNWPKKKFIVCPNPKCRNSINLFYVWLCDKCKRHQKKEHYVTDWCDHCHQELDIFICEHCQAEIEL